MEFRISGSYSIIIFSKHANLALRSPNSGIYANLKQYDLPYPEAIFDIEYFRQNPRPFNTWAKEFFPGENYLPNKG